MSIDRCLSTARAISSVIPMSYDVRKRLCICSGSMSSASSRIAYLQTRNRGLLSVSQRSISMPRNPPRRGVTSKQRTIFFSTSVFARSNSRQEDERTTSHPVRTTMRRTNKAIPGSMPTNLPKRSVVWALLTTPSMSRNRTFIQVLSMISLLCFSCKWIASHQLCCCPFTTIMPRQPEGFLNCCWQADPEASAQAVARLSAPT